MYSYNATVMKIVDGDSLWLEVDVGFRMTYRANFRLAGINTPELRAKDPEKKAAAYAAKARLAELVPVGSEVYIETEKPGKYGRWLAEVWPLGQDELLDPSVNDTLVDEGLAAEYMI